MQKITFTMLSLGVLALTACADPYPPTLRPDYAIRVISTPNGDVAVPPTCADWTANIADPFDNQSLPQFGCATARNLAMSVERPSDLIKGRDLGPERGVNAVGEIRRYDNNQTRDMLEPSSASDSVAAATTMSTPASALVGDVTGAAAASASSTNASSGP